MRTLVARVFSAALLLAAACSPTVREFGAGGSASTGGSSPSASTGTGGSGCASGILCAGECIDPASDNENCGSCGNVCGGASYCKGSMCTCITAGQTYCPSAGCTDTTTDVANCGVCGAACASGMACVGGHCGPNGTTCTNNPACASGNCVGGICCATACSDQGAASCGHDGKCAADGSGCAFYAAGTKCGAASCSGTTLTPPPTCNGSGACKAGTAGPCPGNFKCASALACKTVCTASTDCAAAKYVCGTIAATSGQCLLASGQPCSAGDQCASDGCGGTCL